MSNRGTYICVALFLSVIVIANLIVAHFGPSILPLTAFILIPFDLVTRDILHEKWHSNYLWPKMLLLILAGGILSFFVNRNAINVAIASVSAFTAASITDVAVYGILHRKPLFIKMNMSNLFSAVTDSIIFPYVAFSTLPLNIVLEQSCSKFFGGLIWSFLVVKLFKIRGHNDKNI